MNNRIYPGLAYSSKIGEAESVLKIFVSDFKMNKHNKRSCLKEELFNLLCGSTVVLKQSVTEKNRCSFCLAIFTEIKIYTWLVK